MVSFTNQGTFEVETDNNGELIDIPIDSKVLLNDDLVFRFERNRCPECFATFFTGII